MKFNSILLGLVLLPLLGKAVAAPIPPSPQTLPTTADMVRAQWAWSQQKWTDKDAPYLSQRNRIAALYRLKKVGPTQIKAAKSRSLAYPNDSVARFAWAYTAYCYSLLQPDRSSGYMAQVSQAMALRPDPDAPFGTAFVGPKTPNSYQYARLRFLVACSPGGSAGFSYGNGRYLIQLGERLLKRDPNDQGVKYFQITNLRTGSPADERKAIQYAQDLVKANPQDSASYINLGFIYQRWSWDRQSRFLPRSQAAQLAIAAYKKALEVDRTPGKWRQSTQNNIALLQKLLTAKPR